MGSLASIIGPLAVQCHLGYSAVHLNGSYFHVIRAFCSLLRKSPLAYMV